MTENELQASTDGAAQRPIVTSEDFAAVDFEAPIRDSGSVDCRRFAFLFGSAAASEQEKAGNDVDVRVFGLLAKVAFIHLKPEDRPEPYGPLFVCGDQRTVIPSDLKGEQSQVFAEIAPNVKNPGLRARLSDVAWHNERKRAGMATLAIRSYCEAVQLVLDGQAEFRADRRSASSRPGCKFLHRAFQIAQATGWKDPEGTTLKSLIQNVLQDAFDKRDARGFLNIGKLCLGLGTPAPAPIAANVETLASADDVHPCAARELWKLAAQIHRQSGQQSDMNRCLVNAAECLVTMAAADGGKGAAAASFIMDAIKEYRDIPRTRERREELEKLLREAQTEIPDEMGAISEEVDLTPLVEEARNSVAGASLAQALKSFAILTASPNLAELRAMVEKMAEDNPLWGDMPFAMHDQDGKVVAQSPGLLADGDDRDKAVRHRIACIEMLRRQRQAQGRIEPARCVIQSEHSLDRRDFLPIAEPVRSGRPRRCLRLGLCPLLRGRLHLGGARSRPATGKRGAACFVDRRRGDLDYPKRHDAGEPLSAGDAEKSSGTSGKSIRSRDRLRYGERVRLRRRPQDQAPGRARPDFGGGMLLYGRNLRLLVHIPPVLPAVAA